MGDAASDRPASVELSFDAANHSADAIQRAAYRFSDRFSFEPTSGEDEHRCVLTAVDDADIDALVPDFRTEVLDQILRERIRSPPRRPGSTCASSGATAARRTASC